MSQLIKISLLAKYEIAREGLRNILSGESFQIQASVSDASALFDPQGTIADDVDCHVIVVVINHHTYSELAVRTARSLA